MATTRPKGRLDNTTKENNQSNHLIQVKNYLERKKIQKIKHATIAIKKLQEAIVFQKR